MEQELRRERKETREDAGEAVSEEEEEEESAFKGSYKASRRDEQSHHRERRDGADCETARGSRDCGAKACAATKKKPFFAAIFCGRPVRDRAAAAAAAAASRARDGSSRSARRDRETTVRELSAVRRAFDARADETGCVARTELAQLARDVLPNAARHTVWTPASVSISNENSLRLVFFFDFFEAE